MALPKDVSGQLVLGKLIDEGKALLDRVSDAGWPELNAFRDSFRLYIRVFDELLPEEASKLKTFTFIRFLTYDDSSDEDRDRLSKHADSGWQNETDGRYAFRDFDFGQIQTAVNWLGVLVEKLRLLPLESHTPGPEISQNIPAAKAVTLPDTASAHLVPDTNATHAEAGPAVNGPNTIGAHRWAVLEPILQQKGYSRSKWAAIAGVDPSVVYDYLKGTSNPNPESLKALADAIGVSVDALPK